MRSQTTWYGPKPDPGTVDAFVNYAGFYNLSHNAHAPLYYSTIFQNLQVAVNDVPYLGRSTLERYHQVLGDV